MKSVTLHQHRGSYEPDARRKKALAGGAKRVTQPTKPISLPTIKGLTLEEIEQKYGKAGGK